MAGLLTEESGDLSNYNFAIKDEYKEEDEEYGVMEESLEGPKNIKELPNNRIRPERCPRSLYSQDSTQEDLTIPHYDQRENLNDFRVVIKQEDDENPVMRHFLEEHKDLHNPSLTDPPARCPLYSQDSTQEDLTIPHHDQNEEHIFIKTEVKSEECYVSNNQQCTETGMTRTIKEEDTVTQITTGHAIEELSRDRPALLSDCKMEDKDFTRDCLGEKTMPSAMDGGHHSVVMPWDPSDSEPPSTIRDSAEIQEEGTFYCPDCGESFNSERSLFEHERSHMGKKIYPCPDCGKSFPTKYQLSVHHRSHTGEKPYACFECGKCFSQKAHLSRHQLLHMGQGSYSCTECGKSFLQMAHLYTHQKTHTDEKPYSCPICGKCFSHKFSFTRHQKSHTETKKPYVCFECGKCFSHKHNLYTHQRAHTGEKPYACSECGKCFLNQSRLTRHEKWHAGHEPFSCSECGKRYPHKSDLARHQKSHTGEKEYSCHECGKCFVHSFSFYRHQRSHTGEKPYSCSECGKCFLHKFSLDTHQMSHTGEKPYSCSECGKCFLWKRCLTRHLTTHMTK